ncbi:ComF family protein [Parabacteroides sp. PF5-9]|uniref:ComF family protein n=1 Tax=Parabacteroides sp. PF5-9 TaxID=1742404 RepID=UPI0024759A8D|nr:ComF family protein [Parabacteroides sp. PF5-9]MDH6356281.1 ComF family protein [Parabacteroides sp. PF5-9]
MRKIWNELVNLFYPNLCYVCRNPLVTGEKQICLSCLFDLPRTLFFIQEENPVRALLADRERVRYASAFLHFVKGGSTQQLIHAMKYYGKKELGYQLGRQAALELQAAQSPLCDIDLIIPVPLHLRKKRKRGYNQSEQIAQGIASVWKKPINSTVLTRIKETKTQTNRQIYDRWLNVKETFVVSNSAPLDGLHVLLVDDVITSGATIGACVDVLSEIDELQISVLALSAV